MATPATLRGSPLNAIFTIGVYGYDEVRFRAALLSHRVDLFCDLRARRGLRGRQYSFANSRRLQALLAEAGILYRHYPSLAPYAELRELQHAADAVAGALKRTRSILGPQFIAGYELLLTRDEAASALADIVQSAERPCLFCVERDPRACHRSLAAAALAEITGADVLHLTP